MNIQRIGISNIVRSILLIAIGIVIGVGISVGVGIGRIGNAPSSISRSVGALDRLTVGSDFDTRVVAFDASVRQVSMVVRPDVVGVVRNAADVVEVAL